MTGGELAAQVGAEEWVMPVAGDIRVLLDGPVLEISSSAGMLGAAIAPLGDDLVVDSAEGRLEIHELVRR